MASSSSFSCSFSRSKYVTILLLAFLLIGSCAAGRQGKTMVDHDQRVYMNMKRTNDLNVGRHKTNDFRFRGEIFSFFPKGSPVPPSGPSKRHNSVVNSMPKN